VWHPLDGPSASRMVDLRCGDAPAAQRDWLALRSARRVVPLDSCKDVFTRWRVPVLLHHMGDQRIRELFSVAAQEALLAAWAPHYELVHERQSHLFTWCRRAHTSRREPGLATRRR
jgi:hypothetical protein